MTKEQRTVVERYWEQQAMVDRYRAKSKSVQKGLSAEHWSWLRIARLRNVMIQSSNLKSCSEDAYHFSLNYHTRRSN